MSLSEPTASKRNGSYAATKRLVDIMLAAVVLAVSAPLQCIVALLILRKLGRPIYFVQFRPGQNGRIFKLIKFRSMLHPDENSGLVSDEDRLTDFGKFIRSTSLDELPTLFNVLKGDMSIVGPRPLLVEYLARYTPEQAKRHDVRPGVTGLAQVRGRNLLSWDRKFDLDLEYVERRSLALDAKILIDTVRSVLTRHGIAAADSATMPEFAGSSRGRELKN